MFGEESLYASKITYLFLKNYPTRKKINIEKMAQLTLI